MIGGKKAIDVVHLLCKPENNVILELMKVGGGKSLYVFLTAQAFKHNFYADIGLHSFWQIVNSNASSIIEVSKYYRFIRKICWKVCFRI